MSEANASARMTQHGPRGRRFMTQSMTRAAAALAIAGLLGAGTLACGRYGPPQPYPDGYERPSQADDEEKTS